MAKRRSSTSKSARRRANQAVTQRQKSQSARSPSGDSPLHEGSSVATDSPPAGKKAAARIKVEIPQPHPKADPDAALNAVAEYRQALKQWKSLPFWKRWVTARPQHPTGI